MAFWGDVAIILAGYWLDTGWALLTGFWGIDKFRPKPYQKGKGGRLHPAAPVWGNPPVICGHKFQAPVWSAFPAGATHFFKALDFRCEGTYFKRKGGSATCRPEVGHILRDYRNRKISAPAEDATFYRGILRVRGSTGEPLSTQGWLPLARQAHPGESAS